MEFSKEDKECLPTCELGTHIDRASQAQLRAQKQHSIDNPPYMTFGASDSCMELQEVLRSIPERSPHITIHQAEHRAKLWLRLFTENREGNGHVLLAT
ncbi:MULTISPECIES: hypothetical protein [Auritidibacter]|uniref:hypothetical protein n=1 Tax=Auritidibacter TaxID=1160973 RepID=UPI000D73F482|nr:MULTISPECIES: hypothetical protein [Auritidibacter]PXA76676.1 hypothetical protein DCC24_06450 [Auritidibacter sp. NML100628]WHS34047.1 hypothetical protein QM403_06620 [Auritidibacter ignavus]